MRISIISQYYAPETFSAGTYLRELAEYLAGQGHRVTVQTAFPHYPEGRVWPAYRGRTAMTEVAGDVTIRRSYIFAVPRDRPIIVRALAPVTFALSSFFSALFGQKHDIIYVLYPILPLGVAAIILGKIKRCPVVFGVKDLSIEGLVQAGKLKVGKRQRFFEFLERSLYRAADGIQVPTSNQLQYLLRWRIPQAKITLIPDWADPLSILPMEKENRFRQEQGATGKFVILYSGNIGYASELNTVIESAERLREEKDIVFFIIGDGAKRAELEVRVATSQLTNVTFLPFQDRQRFAESLCAADLALITLNTRFTTVASQGKMYSIMSAGRPILAVMEEHAWGASWVEGEEIGSRVNPGDSARLAAAILHWKAHPAELAKAGQRARELLLGKYTVGKCGAQFEELFELVRRPRGDPPAMDSGALGKASS